MEHEAITMTGAVLAVQLTELPEAFLLQVFKRLPQEDIKSMRLVCTRLCNLCNGASRLSSLKASALLLPPDAAPNFARMPPVSFLDFNARNAACSHQLLAALRQHGGRLEASVRSVRLSGRDGLLAALQTLRLACPRLERLEIRCQHSYRGRHKECSDLGRCLQELEAAFPALAELHLQRFPISSAQLVHLCDSLLGLRALSIRGLAHALTADSLAHLHRLSQLVSLSVDHLRLQGGSLPCGPQLRSLELSDATISAASFASLNNLPGLQSLSVWGTGHRSAVAFAPLTGLTALRRLHLELTLDSEVLEGLAGCTLLAILSAPGARVLPQEAAAVTLTPQLSSVTRLSLEAWSEECLPLAAWLPGLRSLALEDGAGMWSAVAGHEQLTALRADGGGSLPPAAEPAEAAGQGLGPSCGAVAEVVLCRLCGSSGAEACRTGVGCSSSHDRHHNHEYHRHRHNHEHHVGPGGSSDDSGGGGPSGCSGSDGRSSGDGCSSGGDCPGGRSSSCGGSGATSSDSGSDGKAAGGDDADGDVRRQRGETRCSCPGSEAEAETRAVRVSAHGDSAAAAVSAAACRPPPRLASLRLGGCQDLPEQHYLSCAPLPSLTACNLSGCGALTTAALGRLLGAMTALRELVLEGAPYLTDHALADLGLGTRGLEAGGDECIDDEKQAPVGERIVEGEVRAAASQLPPLAVACSPAVAAAARAAVTATGVPVPPCSACACVAEAAVPPLSAAVFEAAVATPAPDDEPPRTLRAAPAAGGGFPRSSSAAALTAAAAMDGACQAAAAAAADAAGAGVPKGAAVNGGRCGAAVALRRLELTRLPSITARGVAAAAAGLPRLTELRVSSCQAVCREACVWLPQQLGRPWLSVVCAHAPVYDDH